MKTLREYIDLVSEARTKPNKAQQSSIDKREAEQRHLPWNARNTGLDDQMDSAMADFERLSAEDDKINEKKKKR